VPGRRGLGDGPGRGRQHGRGHGRRRRRHGHGRHDGRRRSRRRPRHGRRHRSRRRAQGLARGGRGDLGHHPRCRRGPVRLTVSWRARGVRTAGPIDSRGRTDDGAVTGGARVGAPDPESNGAPPCPFRTRSSRTSAPA
ncbi:hypothetical protein GFD30_23475, partial [Glycomyces sp. NEAU-7082]|nr:hypothetical protein [Glycomyces albidus]